MVIATRREPAGVIEVWLEQRAGDLWLGETREATAEAGPETDNSAAVAAELVRVPPNALFATFARYGRAFELGLSPPPPSPDEPRLQVSHAGVVAELRAFRFRGFGDVIASDYLVLTPQADGADPLVVPAQMAASALAVVARAAARVGGAGKGAPGAA